ncbi:hypothetical protein BROUX41_000126 [Berkeleyomyces rouxiae]|uniref:uncharacterized protein n=1 Tax=Berkeleyomyces rouxiae TaxID=2035830 RepID=UPI003B7C7AF1
MEILLMFVVLTFASLFSVSKPRLRLFRSSSLVDSLKDRQKDARAPSSPPLPSSHESVSPATAVSPATDKSMKQALNLLSRKKTSESSPAPPRPQSSLPASAGPPPSSSNSAAPESPPPSPRSAPSIMPPSAIATVSAANTTIRTVPSFEAASSDSSSDVPSITTRNSAFSSSVNSTASMASSHGDGTSNSTQDKTSLALPDRPKESPSAPDSPSIFGDNQYTLSPSAPNQHFLPRDRHPARHDTSADSSHSDLNSTPANNSSLFSADQSDTIYPPASPSLPPAAEPPADMANGPKNGTANDPSWDSTIGKAGLGKTGRVINKLVSDNEALKRDIQIERLRAEEAKQAARMVEEKMERLISDYEGRLLEANVTKTLLSRKERQVESLTAAVELERSRSKDALGREKVWRDEVETLRQSSQMQVDEANNHAQLMEGRYNAIASHWKDQGDEATRVVSKMRSEVVEIVAERRKDDDKITTLRELCDQQHSNIDELQRQKDDILAQFNTYKREQEEQLRDIKTLTAQREQHMEKLLSDSKEALDKLRWALNVKKNVKDAQ